MPERWSAELLIWLVASASFPRSGRKVPEFDDEQLRELIAYSYRIIYQIQAAELVIAAVIHGKRDLTSQ